jgi:hypothetical protein
MLLQLATVSLTKGVGAGVMVESGCGSELRTRRTTPPAVRRLKMTMR